MTKVQISWVTSNYEFNGTTHYDQKDVQERGEDFEPSLT
jgi:hypothetical protein